MNSKGRRGPEMWLLTYGQKHISGWRLPFEEGPEQAPKCNGSSGAPSRAKVQAASDTRGRARSGDGRSALERKGVSARPAKSDVARLQFNPFGRGGQRPRGREAVERIGVSRRADGPVIVKARRGFASLKASPWSSDQGDTPAALAAEKKRSISTSLDWLRFRQWALG